MTRKQKMPHDLKAQIGSFTSALQVPALGVALLLAGCVSAHQVEKTRNDAVIYGEQRRARDIREHCIDSGAMPGTTAYLHCQIKSAK